MAKVRFPILLLAWAAVAFAQGDGRFPVFFRNLSGTYSDDAVYVYALGMDAAGRWGRLLPDGSMRPVDPADADAPDHLTKDGRRFANYAFRFSQAGNFRMPAHITGGRIYISLGSPMYIPLGPNSWGGPDLHNPSDPNADVIYDWYEFTYVHGQISFGGNTTQVDQFGFPLTARLVQAFSGIDTVSGIALSRAEAFGRYAAAVAPAFRPLAGAYRIVAPRSSAQFAAGGAQAQYLGPAIAAAWAHYAAAPFRLLRLGVEFSGGVVDGRLRFTRSPPGPDGAGPFFIDRPSSADAMACAGALARAGMSVTELELGAELCAAFNRGVALDTRLWYAPSAYYATDSLRNDYSGFFHRIGLGGRAYGFPYDDVNDQSTVAILPNALPPDSLVLAVQPFVPASVRFAPRVRHGRATASAWPRVLFAVPDGAGVTRWASPNGVLTRPDP